MVSKQPLRPGLARPLQIVWVGSTTGQCAQLLGCIETACHHLGWTWELNVIDRDIPKLREELEQQLAFADRLIIADENRYDYSHQLIHDLHRQSGIVPWGVVTGLWQAGSRRTGLGLTTYWQMPWYRWWDGWCDWLFPEFARSAAFCGSQYDPLILPIDLAASASTITRPAESRSNSQILIVAACAATGAGWQLSAHRAGWHATCVHPQRLDEALGWAECVPHLIVWDDSCWDRLPGQRVSQQQMWDQHRELSERFPRVPMIVGLQQSNLAQWCTWRLEDSPANRQPLSWAWQWMIKPSHTLPLANRLTWLARESPTKTASAV